MTKVVFTICSANHLPFARTLAPSVKCAEQDVRFVVFLADVLSAPVQQLADALEIVPIDRLGIPNLRRMAFRYDILELNTAIKPFCFDYVFDVLGFQTAIYLDPDIYVLKALHHVHDALEKGTSCVLTPHITAPLPLDGEKPDIYAFMQAGMYNLGFLGLGNTPEARAFNTWWGQKTLEDCFVAQDRGVFADQKFVDFAPSFMNDILILRHPGYNVAYWNLSQRHVSRAADGFKVNQTFDLHFFHFSGIDVANREPFSKYQTRFKTSELSKAVNDLYDAYVAEVLRNRSCGGAALSETPYGFRALDNGLPINRFMRAVYTRYEKELPAGADPFDLDVGFFNARSDKVFNYGTVDISRLYFEIWDSRADLRQAYDIHTQQGQLEFVRWAEAGLVNDYGMPAPLIVRPSAAAGASTGHVTPEELTSLLIKALTSRSFMVQNLIRRLLKGKQRALDYWSRRFGTVQPGRVSRTAAKSRRPATPEPTTPKPKQRP